MAKMIDEFRRVEVKATLRQRDCVWMGTAVGLYRCPADAEHAATEVTGWKDHEVQALAADGDGVLVCAFDGAVATLDHCDAQGVRSSGVRLPEGEKVKAVLRHGDDLWIGTKRGVFRHEGDGWRHVFDGGGKAEILRLWQHGGTLAAAVKKLVPDDRPALIESVDRGDTWSVEVQPDYQDYVVAATAATVITKWRGARRRGATVGFKKHPITAGIIAPDGRSAVIDGDKLEVEMGPGEKLAAYHPAFGDAEHLLLVDGGMIVAGSQGAWRFEPSTGRLSDLLPRPAGGRPHGKIKRVFQLDDALLTTTTFGAFRSFDAGESWERCDSEWWVLDAEHAVPGASGRWWIACQRGLFRTDDRGGRIDYHKIKVSGAHYGELRSLAVAGERVLVGSKQGLLVNRPGGDPEQFQRVEAFGGIAIEGLAWDPAAGNLYVGTSAGRLYAWDLVAPPVPIAELPVHEAIMTAGDGRLWLASEGRICEIAGRTVRDLTPAGSGAELGLLDLGERLLAWDRRSAWIRRKSAGSWSALPGWAAGIRHVAYDAARDRLITTDRAALAAFDL